MRERSQARKHQQTPRRDHSAVPSVFENTKLPPVSTTAPGRGAVHGAGRYGRRCRLATGDAGTWKSARLRHKHQNPIYWRRTSRLAMAPRHPTSCWRVLQPEWADTGRPPGTDPVPRSRDLDDRPEPVDPGVSLVKGWGLERNLLIGRTAMSSAVRFTPFDGRLRTVIAALDSPVHAVSSLIKSAACDTHFCLQP